jgi:hypothetical protein
VCPAGHDDVVLEGSRAPCVAALGLEVGADAAAALAVEERDVHHPRLGRGDEPQ